MKHIREYNEEIKDLAGDLGEIGHEMKKGWYAFSAKHGWIIIAESDSEAESLIRSTFPSSSEYFPNKTSKNGYFFGDSMQTAPTFLEAFFKNLLYYHEAVSQMTILKDLKVKDQTQKPIAIRFPLFNSFLCTELLEKYFSDIKSQMITPDMREAFDDSYISSDE